MQSPPRLGYLAPRYPCRGRGVIATRLREDSRFTEALGVSGVGGVGNRKVVLAGRTTLGVTAPRDCTVFGLGGGRGLAYTLCGGR